MIEAPGLKRVDKGVLWTVGIAKEPKQNRSGTTNTREFSVGFRV